MSISNLLQKNNNNLDLVRIFLAIGVIFGHTLKLNGHSNFWVDPISLLYSATYSGSLAVKIFFFISGLVVTNSCLQHSSLVYFIISRLFRIMPALIFICLITVFIFGPLLTNLNTHTYFSSLDNLIYIRDNLVFKTHYLLPGVFENNYFPNTINGSLWSLKFEVKYYLYLCTFFFISKKYRRKYLTLILLTIILYSFIPEEGLYFTRKNTEISLLPMAFSLGVILAINSFISIANLKYMALLSFLSFFIFKQTYFAENFLVIGACLLILYVSSLQTVLKWKPKYDISYGIYLWGFLIQQTMVNYFGTIYAGFHFVSSLLITIIFSFISYLYVEKPTMLIGKKIIPVISEYVQKNNFKKIFDRLF
jgi:peptidoglycan/LPS O-acetylase OafA/YrhL